MLFKLEAHTAQGMLQEKLHLLMFPCRLPGMLLKASGNQAACCIIWIFTGFALPMHGPQPACQWSPCRLDTGQVVACRQYCHMQKALPVLHHSNAALQAGDGLIVPLDERRIGRPTSSAAVAAQWFAQDLFAGADVEDKEPTAVGMPAGAATPASQQRKAAASESARKARKLQQAPAAAAGSARRTADQQAAGVDVEAAPGSKGARAVKQQQPAAAQAEADSEDGGAADVLQQQPAEAEPAGFVEVPLAAAEDSDASSEDEFGNLDDNGKAEVLALAKKMLGGRVKNVSAQGLVADLLPVGPELLKHSSPS